MSLLWLQLVACQPGVRLEIHVAKSSSCPVQRSPANQIGTFGAAGCRSCRLSFSAAIYLEREDGWGGGGDFELLVLVCEKSTGVAKKYVKLAQINHHTTQHEYASS